MSWTLGIDTSTIEMGIGLVNNDGVAAGFSRYFRNSHAEHIAKSVDFLCTTSGISASDIGHIGIAVGPGSFTGLRIGIAFVKGFAFGRQIDVLPVSSLHSAALACGIQGTVTVIFDARNDELYTARFSLRNNVVTRLTDDACLPVDAGIATIHDTDTIIIDTLGNAKSTLTATVAVHSYIVVTSDKPLLRGVACAQLAHALRTTPEKWTRATELHPEYFSLSAAEKRIAS